MWPLGQLSKARQQYDAERVSAEYPTVRRLGRAGMNDAFDEDEDELAR